MMLQLASEYDPNQPDHGRSSARIALIGVMNFLAVLFPHLDTLPLALQDLLQGLVDLDQGTLQGMTAAQSQQTCKGLARGSGRQTK
jgi:hypothetical protein